MEKNNEINPFYDYYVFDSQIIKRDLNDHIKTFVAERYSCIDLDGRSTSKDCAYDVYDEENSGQAVLHLIFNDKDILLEGFGKSARHENYDRDITVVPGIRRMLFNDENVLDAFYEHLNQNRFRIVTDSGQLFVDTLKDGWLISKNVNELEKVIAKIVIIKISDTDGEREKDRYLSSRYEIYFRDFEDKRWYSYVMAIPVLGF